MSTQSEGEYTDAHIPTHQMIIVIAICDMLKLLRYTTPLGAYNIKIIHQCQWNLSTHTLAM